MELTLAAIFVFILVRDLQSWLFEYEQLDPARRLLAYSGELHKQRNGALLNVFNVSENGNRDGILLVESLGR